MKRVLSILVALVIMVASMAGCGQTGNSSKGTGKAGESQPVKKERIKLVLNLGPVPNDDLAVKKALEEVQKMDKFSYVDFTVMENDADYQAKMPIMVASGQQMDAVTVANSIKKADFARAKTIQPLDQLISKAGLDFKNIFGADANLAKDGDKTVLVPLKKTTWMLYYNKSLFDQAKKPYPDPKVPMTWAEYSKLAKELTTGTGADKKFGALHLTWGMYWYGEPIMALGGGENFYNKEGLSNIEAPIFSKALERTYNMMNLDKSIPTYSDLVTSKTSAPAFMNGKYAMNAAGSWILTWATDKKTYPRDWKLGIAPMPVDEGKKLKTWGDVKGFAIPQSSKYPEVAFDVIMEIIKLGAQYSTVDPHSYKLAKSDKLFDDIANSLKDDGITKADITYLMNNPDIQFCTEKVTGANNSQYEQVINEEVEKYFVQAQDLAKTIANIKERGNKAIQAK